MSEQPFHDNDDGSENAKPNWRRELEADAKAGREAAAQLEAAQADARSAQRELAMRRAGVDLDSPIGALFAKAYDGEIDGDQILTDWNALSGSAGGGVSAQDQAAMTRISQAAGGATPTAGGGMDFEAQLDTIPILVDGQYNPNYVGEVLAKTQEQAIREGSTFTVVGNAPKFAPGSGPAIPAATPLRGD